jgi:hypothetical protein
VGAWAMEFNFVEKDLKKEVLVVNSMKETISLKFIGIY